MSFCPKCRAEYETGFARCADCEVPLVNKLPEPKQAEIESAVVHLCSVPNAIEAIFICDLLKQAGIEATYRALRTSQYIAITRDDLFNQNWGEIIVLDKDYITAKEIVDTYLKDIENQKNEGKPEEKEA
jgi:hypothetical protein